MPHGNAFLYRIVAAVSTGVVTVVGAAGRGGHLWRLFSLLRGGAAHTGTADIAVVTTVVIIGAGGVGGDGKTGKWLGHSAGCTTAGIGDCSKKKDECH